MMKPWLIWAAGFLSFPLAAARRRGQAGFTITPGAPKTGGNAIAEAELYFDGVFIDRDAVILPPEPESTRAAQVMLKQFNPERCGNAATVLGVAPAVTTSAIQRPAPGSTLHDAGNLPVKVGLLISGRHPAIRHGPDRNRNFTFHHDPGAGRSLDNGDRHLAVPCPLPRRLVVHTSPLRPLRKLQLIMTDHKRD